MSLSQLHKLLESTECDMVREVQRRINRDLTLVVSERARQSSRLPTGKKKKKTVKLTTNLRLKNIIKSMLSLVRLVEESAAETQFGSGAATDCGNLHPASDGRS